MVVNYEYNNFISIIMITEESKEFTINFMKEIQKTKRKTYKF